MHVHYPQSPTLGNETPSTLELVDKPFINFARGGDHRPLETDPGVRGRSCCCGGHGGTSIFDFLIGLLFVTGVIMIMDLNLNLNNNINNNNNNDNMNMNMNTNGGRRKRSAGIPWWDGEGLSAR